MMVFVKSAMCPQVTYESDFSTKSTIAMGTSRAGRKNRPWLLLAFFSTPSFLFQSLASSHLESCNTFSDGCFPERSVPCCLLPASGVNVALLEVCFQYIFEALLLAPSRPLAIHQFRVKDLLGKTLVWHSYHVAAPSELVLDDAGFDAGYFCFLLYTNIGSSVFPADVKDLPETALMELLQSFQMLAVGGPGL